MALATWWAGDVLPDLDHPPDFGVAVARDSRDIEAINGISLSEGRRRIAGGHNLYIGYVNSSAVTYGWVATTKADVGELGLDFDIPESDRYLWDFVTASDWRGRGLYPRLLQAIVGAEQAERLWIIHAPENGASGSGIDKAGFDHVGHLSFQPDGTPALLAAAEDRRAVVGADLLGVRLVTQSLSPCWCCVRETHGCQLCRTGEAHDCDCGRAPG